MAEAASRETVGVAKAIARLQAHGRLERGGDVLVGAHGLTRRPTAHTLTIGDQRLHTWCAYDAVSIPVALNATARATTSCPTCGREMAVEIIEGHLPDIDAPGPVLWIAPRPVRVHANLFCGPDHLDTWRHTAGDPPGEIVTLAEVPALARRAWADIAAHP